MPSVVFNSTINKVFSGEMDFSIGGFKVMLMTKEYRPDKKLHSKRSDLAQAEATGFSYEPGGKAVSVEINQDGGHNRIDILLGGTIWEGSSINARGAIYYHLSSNDLVAYIDFGGDVTSTNGNFELTESTLRIQN